MKSSRTTRVPTCRPLACALVLACAAPLQATPPAAFDATVTNGATSVAVHFVHHPIRGAGFQVQVQDAAGNLNTVAAPEARTYTGTVTGYPGASACALLQPDGTLWEYIQDASKKNRPSIVDDDDWEGVKKRPKANDIQSIEKSKQRARNKKYEADDNE